VVENPAAAGQDHFARWSPEGRRLVLWRGRDGADGPQAAVFVVNLDGTGLRKLTPWSLLAGDPDWVPDGTGLRRLTAFGPNGPRATQPRWTPDGTAILYTRTSQSGLPRQIYAITRDGHTDAPVATAQEHLHPPGLAADAGSLTACRGAAESSSSGEVLQRARSLGKLVACR
jgi:TolB protein